MVDAWREDADRVAERAVALGFAPDGRAAPLEDLDPVTADVLHGVIATLEEQLWMIRVQAG